MHPLFRQVPPITHSSQIATSAPSSVALIAAEKAAEPPPRIIRSNSLGDASLATGISHAHSLSIKSPLQFSFLISLKITPPFVPRYTFSSIIFLEACPVACLLNRLYHTLNTCPPLFKLSITLP